MWYERAISHHLTTLATQFPALVVTGARQSGKTTLLRRLFPQHRYVSLDLPSLAALAEESPESFLRQHPPPLLVDEVQYAPQLFRFLKIAIDADRHTMGSFILTGSQKFSLMRSVTDSLAGRCAVCELETLSLAEIAQHQRGSGAGAELMHSLCRGGFPDLWRDASMDSDAFFRSYVSTYLERDVRQLLQVSSLRDFERFLRACAARNAQVLDKAALAREVGISPRAAATWLDVLQASNQVSLLEPWFRNLGKRLSKRPKLYFNDTGLLAYFLGLTPATLQQGAFAGALWETAVFAEVRKHLAVATPNRSVWFYRDAEGHEVDFMIVGGGRAQLLEAKWKELPTPHDTAGVRRWMQQARQKPHAELQHLEAFLVCRTPNRFLLSSEPEALVAALPLPELRVALQAG